MTAINVAFDLANTETAVIPVDRWGYPGFMVQLDSGTSILVEGTLDRINRGETATWDTLDDKDGTALTAFTGGLAYLRENPLEAIRITATGACVGRVVQTGAG